MQRFHSATFFVALFDDIIIAAHNTISKNLEVPNAVARARLRTPDINVALITPIKKKPFQKIQFSFHCFTFLPVTPLSRAFSVEYR